MSIPLEHDYIGLSGNSSMERISDKISSSFSSSPEVEKNKAINLMETELRLGLPGSAEARERKDGPGMPLFGKCLEDKTSGDNLNPLKNFVSGSKRGFSAAIDASDKWIFSMNGGSEVDLSKGAVLFSPRDKNVGSDNNNNNNNNNNNTKQSYLLLPVVKESCPPPPTSRPAEEKKNAVTEHNSVPAAKAQVVGWPPIRSFRKNTLATNLSKRNEIAEENSGSGCFYVKVSMDGAPYLRKLDLTTCCSYAELSSALEKMFSCFTIGQCSSDGSPGRDGGLSESCLMDLLHGSEYVLTYEDKDGDWMLVGDVPWQMFIYSCKRIRIMKGSEAIGLAPRAMEKCKNRK